MSSATSVKIITKSVRAVRSMVRISRGVLRIRKQERNSDSERTHIHSPTNERKKENEKRRKDWPHRRHELGLFNDNRVCGQVINNIIPRNLVQATN